MVEALSRALTVALDAGDLDAARVAHEANGKLLSSPPPGQGAEVVSIAGRRKGDR